MSQTCEAQGLLCEGHQVWVVQVSGGSTCCPSQVLGEQHKPYNERGTLIPRLPRELPYMCQIAGNQLYTLALPGDSIWSVVKTLKTTPPAIRIIRTPATFHSNSNATLVLCALA